MSRVPFVEHEHLRHFAICNPRNETSVDPDPQERVESEVNLKKETSTDPDPEFKHKTTVDL